MSATTAISVALTQASIDQLQARLTITVPEAADLLGIGRNAAYEAAHRGDLPSLRFGTRIVIPVRPLLRLLGIEQ